MGLLEADPEALIRRFVPPVLSALGYGENEKTLITDKFVWCVSKVAEIDRRTRAVEHAVHVNGVILRALAKKAGVDVAALGVK